MATGKSALVHKYSYRRITPTTAKMAGSGSKAQAELALLLLIQIPTHCGVEPEKDSVFILVSKVVTT
jgi:hypothetical protein